MLRSFLIIVLISVAVSAQERQQIVNTAMAIRPGAVQPFTFYVGGGGGRIVGRFQSADNIEVYILDQDSYVNWMNGANVPAFYNSGRITVSNVNVSLPAGNYVLVFSNRYSVFSSKAVTATIFLESPSVTTYESVPLHTPSRSRPARSNASVWFDDTGRLTELAIEGGDVEGCELETTVGVITKARYNSRRIPVEFILRRNNRRLQTIYTTLESSTIRSVYISRLPSLIRRGNRVRVEGFRCGVSGAIYQLSRMSLLN